MTNLIFSVSSSKNQLNFRLILVDIYSVHLIINLIWTDLQISIKRLKYEIHIIKKEYLLIHKQIDIVEFRLNR